MFLYWNKLLNICIRCVLIRRSVLLLQNISISWDFPPNFVVTNNTNSKCFDQKNENRNVNVKSSSWEGTTNLSDFWCDRVHIYILWTHTVILLRLYSWLLLHNALYVCLCLSCYTFIGILTFICPHHRGQTDRWLNR